MEDDLEKLRAKMNANDLLGFQRDLKQERELLSKILTKIDNRVHSLQVEQLHLLGLMHKSLKGAEDKSNDNQEPDSANKYLDLSIDAAFKYFQEEIEDDDDI